MSAQFEMMIPGAASNDGVLVVKSPYDNVPIAEAAAADTGAVEQALSTADRIFRDRQGWLKPWQRIEILTRAAEIMAQRAEDLAVEAAREGGKPLIDSRVEVARAIDSVRACVAALRTQSGDEIPMNLNPASAGRAAFTSREPIGVVAAISAFNHPLNLIAHQVAPAVATGCPVIVKPAQDTPLSCFRFVRILQEAGLPPEWCQALVVKDLALATGLAADSRIAFLSFIGSARVGWMLRSKLAPGTRCALEHGGAAPVIVAGDADLEAAVPLLAKGGFYHAGQVCVSVQRVFAHRAIAAELGEKLSAAADAMRIGDPTRAETEVGPLIRPREVDRVEAWVAEAETSGARILTGGRRVSDTCYACTVLFDPPDDAKVSQLEVFGPVVCVYSFDDLDQAIARANALPTAFQSAVFTRDIDTAMQCCRSLDAAAVMVNDHTAFRVDWMPFAGLRESGLGTGGIPYTMRDMQIEKLMVLRSPGLQ